MWRASGPDPARLLPESGADKKMYLHRFVITTGPIRPGSVPSLMNTKTMNQKWYVNYDKLKKYYERFGTCNVPKGWKEDPALANWVRRHRCDYKKHRLTHTQISLLNELSFKWSNVSDNKITQLVNEIEKMLYLVCSKKNYRKSQCIKMEWWTMVGRGVNQWKFKGFEYQHPLKKHLGVNTKDVLEKKNYEPWELDLYFKAAEILQILDPVYMGTMVIGQCNFQNLTM